MDNIHQKKPEKDDRCPLEYGLSVFGGKWKSQIICVLAAKEPLRYSELRKKMANTTDAMLTSTPKELIADGILARQSSDEIPPKMEYSLTSQRKIPAGDSRDFSLHFSFFAVVFVQILPFSPVFGRVAPGFLAHLVVSGL